MIGPLARSRGRAAAGTGVLRLPPRLADFTRRGFRLDRPADRAVLEEHAGSFITGFNLAVAHWRDPHPALATIPEYERGFAYEGAGMHAALRDLATAGHARALRRLLDGPGAGYVHLVHVGYGWALASVRLPLPVPMPSTPLLRWLAMDGAGFARTYFGGLRALRRQCLGRPTARWQVRMAGCGRALWFVESADIDSITSVVNRAPEPARPQLWSGIGLASCYAGCVDEQGVDRLVAASARYGPQLGQGALFAIAARCRAGAVPPHTEHMCRRLFDVIPAEAASWTDVAARGLTDSMDISAYAEWRSRLSKRVASRF